MLSEQFSKKYFFKLEVYLLNKQSNKNSNAVQEKEANFNFETEHCLCLKVLKITAHRNLYEHF